MSKRLEILNRAQELLNAVRRLDEGAAVMVEFAQKFIASGDEIRGQPDELCRLATLEDAATFLIESSHRAVDMADAFREQAQAELRKLEPDSEAA
jgi:hypothetical protein